MDLLAGKLRAQGFLRIGAGEIEGDGSLLRSFRGVAQVGLKNRRGNVGSRRITGNEGRPRSQAHADRGIGFKLHVGDGKVPPVLDFFGGPNPLKRWEFHDSSEFGYLK